MTTITIITIVVVALLTVVIFGLAWLAYSSCLKSYRVEVDAGKHDAAIKKEYCTKKKCKAGLVGTICSYLALLLLSGLFVTGLIYKVNNEQFTINNETVLVIETGSMSHFYDDEAAAQYHGDTSLQFDVGDICVFETEFDLVEGEVYGYKSNQYIITHRLVSIHDNGYCQFKGDANYTSDVLLVDPDNIIYHYTGRRVPGIGAFILFAQSYFGLWSAIGVIGIAVSGEIVAHKIETINKARAKRLGGRV